MKELYQEDVFKAIELLKEKISKKNYNLDRHLNKQEKEIHVMNEEVLMLEKLQDILPERDPKLIEPVNEEEK